MMTTRACSNLSKESPLLRRRISPVLMLMKRLQSVLLCFRLSMFLLVCRINLPCHLTCRASTPPAPMYKCYSASAEAFATLPAHCDARVYLARGRNERQYYFLDGLLKANCKVDFAVGRLREMKLGVLTSTMHTLFLWPTSGKVLPHDCD